ncbi:TlyA family RNA methyltransferase [Candidatus Dependentiae bacterium]
MTNKKRLDVLVHELYPQYSRRQIQSWIMQGKIIVDDKVVTKSGTQVKPDVKIVITAKDPKFVGRAGFKLEKALDYFKIDVTGLIILDAGLSTGGFTDCLLQRGAKKIYGIDVGYGQVHEKIRQDEHVVVIERTNLRHTQDVVALITEKYVDMVTLDLSFISILKVMETVSDVLKPGGQLVTLIKPQFEAGKHEVGKGGIVKDEKIHKKVIEQVTSGIQEHGFELIGITDSPIQGATGNKEFLAYFKKK